MPSRSARPAALLSALCCIVLALTALPSQANFGSTDRSACGDAAGTSGPTGSGCVSLANNSSHAIATQNLGDWPGAFGAVQHVANNVLTTSQTDINAYIDNSDPLPDVRVRDGFWPALGYFGWVDCPENNTGTGGSGNLQWCRGQILRINASYRAEYQTYSNRGGIDGLMCHEMGHTIGLRHRNKGNTCMRRTVDGSRPSNLSPHDITHLEGWY